MKLDDLYHVVTEVDLPNGRKITVRTLSDFEIQARDQCALDSARALDKLLKDEESEEYREHIGFLEEASGDKELRDMIVLNQEMRVRADVRKEYKFPFIPMPDDPTFEERLEVLERREEAEAEVRRIWEEKTKERLDAFRQDLKEMDHDQLLREGKARYALLAYNSAYIDASNRATLYHACYLKGQKLFASPGMVRDFNPKVLQKLYDAYLEVDKVDIWELEKNSLTAVSTDS